MKHALAGDNNAAVMAEVWASFYQRKPPTFNKDMLAACKDRPEKALVAWRGICRSHAKVTKPEFAQRLAQWLEKNPEAGFDTPPYLRSAIEHVAKPLLG